MLDGVHREPDPAAPDHAAGTAGECWVNAQTLCRQDPARYAYVEGIVSLGGGWEEHGYAVDRAAGHVIETTAGYERAVAYRGCALDLAAVDEWWSQAGHSGWDGFPGMIYALMWDAIETAGKPYHLPRSFRLPRGLVLIGRIRGHIPGITGN